MRRQFKNFDMVIVICICVIFIIGLLFLYSASKSLEENVYEKRMIKQILSMLIGVFAGTIVFSIDYRKLLDLSYLFYWLMNFLLFFVLVLGAIRLGAQRWISIGGIAFQPSEFAKIIFILAIASFLGRRKESIENKRNIIKPLFLLGVPFFLIAAQPDLGTALVLIPVFFAMLFISGINVKVLLGFIGAGVMTTPFLWHFLKEYQRKRILVFLNPNIDPLGAGYTIIQSKVAIGSGQLFGKGWLSGTQNQLNFLPERHTDFIFSVVGEEWGFVGCSIVLLLYFIIIYRGIIIMRETKDLYGKLIACGVVSLLSFQIFINIGMTIGLLPVVGLTLPFISYGGSSLISSIMAVALLLNVGYRKPYF
ncbi:MAG: rod shape-determining protein RodA [Candidatus Omnitrophica bacterium]|nr:rod shape-determining protein RodA [Candidatus Omnitrophota bacterium]